MVERITVTIETGTSAFDVAPSTEIARILRHLSRNIADGGTTGNCVLADSNGIIVGRVTIQRVRE